MFFKSRKTWVSSKCYNCPHVWSSHLRSSANPFFPEKPAASCNDSKEQKNKSIRLWRSGKSSAPSRWSEFYQSVSCQHRVSKSLDWTLRPEFSIKPRAALKKKKSWENLKGTSPPRKQTNWFWTNFYSARKRTKRIPFPTHELRSQLNRMTGSLARTRWSS